MPSGYGENRVSFVWLVDFKGGFESKEDCLKLSPTCFPGFENQTGSKMVEFLRTCKASKHKSCFWFRQGASFHTCNLWDSKWLLGWTSPAWGFDSITFVCKAACGFAQMARSARIQPFQNLPNRRAGPQAKLARAPGYRTWGKNEKRGPREDFFCCDTPGQKEKSCAPNTRRQAVNQK